MYNKLTKIVKNLVKNTYCWHGPHKPEEMVLKQGHTPANDSAEKHKTSRKMNHLEVTGSILSKKH